MAAITANPDSSLRLQTDFSSPVVVTDHEEYVNTTEATFLFTEEFSSERNDTFRHGFGLNVHLTATIYGIVFVLAIVGNILVLVTLAQDKRMRTVTNMFLLSLSTSDLLFGIFCMPFTVVGNILGRFVFGGFICKIVPFVQGKTCGL